MMQKSTKFGKRGYHRPQLNEFPPLGLPFYPRSTGHVVIKRPYEEDVPAGIKPFVQIFWIESGEIQFMFDGKPHLLKAGDICYRLPHEEHKHKLVSETAEYWWLAFDGNNCRSFIESYNYPRSGWHAGQCPAELFVEFEERMHELTPYCWRRMCSIITELLCRAGNDLDDTDNVLPLFRQAVLLCRSEFKSRDFNVGFLADAMKVNRSTVNRYFVKYMNIPVGKYIEQLRVQHAVLLLQSTNCTLKEISGMSGFYDAGYLCRIIKKHYGTTPGKLRN